MGNVSDVQTQTIELRDLRYAGAGMLGAAAVWPALPLHPPLVCPLRTLTGIPCPFCGMTRAVVAAVHGNVVASLRFNPGGIVLVVLALALVLGWRMERVRLPKWLLPVLLGALWVYNLALNPTF
ncbi:MAG: hypothetical protein QOI55_2307 [Actinomycetota bacterium]|nr:hypothetical protein [Actinomycetota bacterium]